MNVDKEYYWDTIKDGFYVPSLVKRSWAAQMTVLIEIDKICKKYNISWFADWGTLLGTIRHSGFIPWDDDLDICMLQDDYLKFLSVIEKELPVGYRVLNMRTESSFTDFLTRIVNSSYINTTKDFLDKNSGFPYIAGVDIFCLNYLYDTKEKEEERQNKLSKLWEIEKQVSQSADYSTDEIIKTVEQLSNVNVRRDLELVDAINRIIEGIFFECNCSDVKKVANMPYYIKDKTCCFEKEWFDKTDIRDFETIEINVPHNYEKILIEEYGDEWIKPIRTGGDHNYPFFINQEKILEETSNSKIKYRYDIERILHENKNDGDIAFLSRTFYADIIQKVNQNVELVYLNVVRQKSECYTSICVLQELLILLGNSIEERLQENVESIKLIETICEELYVLTKAILDSPAFESIKIIQNIMDYIKILFKQIILDIKKYGYVVFLPFNADYWSEMKRIYNRCIAEGMNAVVAPIRCYYKENDGSTNELISKWISYSENLNLYNIDDLIENKDIGRVYIQFPFDEYNTAVDIDEQFYSYNLKKIIPEVIFCPWFKLRDCFGFDEKSFSIGKYYIISSALFNSDKILVDCLEEKVIFEEFIKITTGHSIIVLSCGS